MKHFSSIMLDRGKRFVPCCNKTSNSRNPFSPILNMFLIFGIDFYPSRSKSRTIWLVQKFMIFCWGLVFVVMVSYFRYTLKYVHTKGHVKLRFMRILEVMNSFFIFYVVHRSRKKVSSVVCEIANLGLSFHLAPSSFASISALAVIFSQAFICFGALYPYDEKRYRNIFSQFAFEIPTNLTDRMIFYVLLVLFNFLVGVVEIFPFCVVLFYGTVCRYLQEMLSVYVKNLEISSGKVIAEDVDDCFRRYDSILAALHHFEDAVSFPIFLVFAMSVSGIFFGILVLEGDFWISYLPPSGTVILSTTCFGSFMLMSCLASGVNECDKRAKRAHHELLKRMLPGGITLRADKRLSFLIMNCEPPFALTGWGFFQFTKAFLLGAIGCVFTYAFFIASL